MNNVITELINYLKQEKGSHSRAARFLWVDPRLYRNQRKQLKMSNSARRSIILGAKLLRLRKILRILRDEFNVPESDILNACKIAENEQLSDLPPKVAEKNATTANC